MIETITITQKGRLGGGGALWRRRKQRGGGRGFTYTQQVTEGRQVQRQWLIAPCTSLPLRSSPNQALSARGFSDPVFRL